LELEKRMLALQIFDYLFQFVCEIMPELEKDGIPKEYMPQSRFRNVSNLPLNQYGKGPFCRFKITHAFRKTGAYLVVINETPKYVGECEDFGNQWDPPDISMFYWKPTPPFKFSLAEFAKVVRPAHTQPQTVPSEPAFSLAQFIRTTKKQALLPLCRFHLSVTFRLLAWVL